MTETTTSASTGVRPLDLNIRDGQYVFLPARAGHHYRIGVAYEDGAYLLGTGNEDGEIEARRTHSDVHDAIGAIVAVLDEEGWIHEWMREDLVVLYSAERGILWAWEANGDGLWPAEEVLRLLGATTEQKEARPAA
jgi:hypothetical protein